jgi:succinyl-CoA synthetase beta subunit
MVEAPLRRARAAGRRTLTEPEAKALLETVGISTPVSRVVQTVDEAVEAAEAIGYPVVVKVSAPEITHKSDWDGGTGVAVNLVDGAAVRSAATNIRNGLAAAGIDGQLLVEESVDTDRRTELILGGARRPSFGPIVLLGVGGVVAEAVDDVTHRLAPLTLADANEMMDELRGTTLLDGFRGLRPVDRDQLAAVVVAMGELLEEHDGIAEIDVNPLVVGGGEPIALDALVVLAD